jgi:hypothetical protein
VPRGPRNTKGVDPPLFALILVPTLLGITHHLDHVVRGNHVGWPLAEVTPFTYSLLIYPVIAVGLALTLADRVGARYWVVTTGVGAVMLWFFHLSPWAVEPPADVILPYANPVVGYLAFAALVALILSLLVATGYATYRWRVDQLRELG